MLSRASIKKLSAAVAGGAPSLPTLIIIGGLAKQFVGELVEEGRRVMADRGEGGPLRPVHVQEAHRRLAARGASPVASCAAPLPRVRRSADAAARAGKLYGKASRVPLLGGRSAAARVRL